ncbi:hypothetical protein M407DRAFT_22363 [Tulasnella calospora MUT 4182]|uniref:Ras-associating domain-containing protein n=1 Tax=Tulasnella calospora MUT 4182 TaxID=1051891 RepID=A0A0C3QLJ0_9AGAM|nr:hypothetical protein M407DRAFT_22363 [Tulasnella calospora MUT 4182]
MDVCGDTAGLVETRIIALAAERTFLCAITAISPVCTQLALYPPSASHPALLHIPIMQEIRLLETQQQPIPSRPGSASSKKPYEPWNDIQFSVDGDVATSGGSMSGAMLGISGAASDLSAIAPWMIDDSPVQDSLQPAPVPKRALFKSSMSKASTGKDFGRLLKRKTREVGLAMPDNGRSALPRPPLTCPISNEDMTARPPSDALSNSAAPQTLLPAFHLRVYCIDGSYRIVECPLSTVALDLAHVLRKKLLLPGQHYKLHIRERGRERVLGPQERPINILRRRLEQAGYDESDDLEHLGGEDISFLLRFVFRDANLPTVQPTDQDVLSSIEYINLTGRGLITIPILLHRHAPTIVVLNLSKNPHIDLPLDFIASCTMLRDLRLSQAAMKQVPSGVKHISTLHELDISSNCMVSLDEAELHRIPGLRNIQVQNNRLSTLPKSFAEMKALKFLNISNNKLDSIPPVLSQITSLVDLDLSFNTVLILPPTLRELTNMERLVIVGNRIASIPPEIVNMSRLKEFDCRRNAITDLSPLFKCPALEILCAGNNALHGVELAGGSKIKALSVPENERLSSFTVQPLEDGSSYALETLDLSKCMLSSFNELGLSELKKLTSLKFDHNTIRKIPDSICQLPDLERLSGSNNHLISLPTAIGSLRKLRALHVHNNNIKTIPASIWQCEALTDFNASSNLIATWSDPVDDTPADDTEKKPGSASGKLLPSLASSLQRLYLADNQLDDDIFHSVSRLRSLKILNLSFNDIYELPPIGRMPAFATVQELYLSGNKLTSLPAEDLHQLHHLRVLFLNANKLQNLPSDLGKVKGLECLDVGGNVLKYNVGNWKFDWNWWGSLLTESYQRPSLTPTLQEL